MLSIRGVTGVLSIYIWVYPTEATILEQSYKNVLVFVPFLNEERSLQRFYLNIRSSSEDCVSGVCVCVGRGGGGSTVL